MQKTRIDITLNGVCNDGSEALKPVDLHMDQVHAAVVFAFRQHNNHSVIQQGAVMGDFDPKYCTMIMIEMVKNFGLGKVTQALARAALRRPPFEVIDGE